MNLLRHILRALDPRIPTGPESETWPSAFEGTAHNLEHSQIQAGAAVDSKEGRTSRAKSPLDAVTGGTCHVLDWHSVAHIYCGQPAVGWQVTRWSDGEMRIRACVEHQGETND